MIGHVADPRSLDHDGPAAGIARTHPQLVLHTALHAGLTVADAATAVARGVVADPEGEGHGQDRRDG